MVCERRVLAVRTSVGCEGPCGVALTASGPRGSGRTPCHCRTAAHPLLRSPTANDKLQGVNEW